MALSNIFREPRREITEQAVGLVAVAPFLALVAAFAAWFANGACGPECKGTALAYIVGAFLGAVVLALGSLLLIGGSMAVHAIGEGVCNRAEAAGIRLRPARNRGR